jgi:hypothetical protein
MTAHCVTPSADSHLLNDEARLIDSVEPLDFAFREVHCLTQHRVTFAVVVRSESARVIAGLVRSSVGADTVVVFADVRIDKGDREIGSVSCPDYICSGEGMQGHDMTIAIESRTDASPCSVLDSQRHLSWPTADLGAVVADAISKHAWFQHPTASHHPGHLAASPSREASSDDVTDRPGSRGVETGSQPAPSRTKAEAPTAGGMRR